jgi:hypothetical protein
MASQLIPLTSSPNQTLRVSLNVNGAALDLYLYLHYNEIAQYWVMTVSNASGTVLIDSVPFITGNEPAGNLLGQFAYLGLGGATIINASQVPSPSVPNNSDLGSDFVLVWYDESPYAVA